MKGMGLRVDGSHNCTQLLRKIVKFLTLLLKIALSLHEGAAQFLRFHDQDSTETMRGSLSIWKS